MGLRLRVPQHLFSPCLRPTLHSQVSFRAAEVGMLRQTLLRHPEPRSRRRMTFGLMIIALCAAPLFADAPGVYAITGGTVHPVSGPQIPNGVVIIRDGVIEAVGANLAIPPDAATSGAGGLQVYPGLIEAQPSLGFPSAPPPPRRRAGGARPQPAAT